MTFVEGGFSTYAYRRKSGLLYTSDKQLFSDVVKAILFLLSTRCNTYSILLLTGKLVITLVTILI